MNRQLALKAARYAMKCKSISAYCRWFRANILPLIPKKTKRGTWYTYAQTFLRGMSGDLTDVAFNVFSEGNSKLTFVNFSALPLVTCPGAGDCASWCYSLKAWRYPAPFFRQLQNTLLLRFREDVVESAFMAIPQDTREVRLYVDGDFESVHRLSWWMSLVYNRPDLECYGYSKSWVEFIQYFNAGGQFPGNYTLNVSSGSVHDADQVMKAAILKLPCVRGEFVGVQVEGDFGRGFQRYHNPDYHRAVRTAALEILGQKAISCPGQCGDCGAGRAMCSNKDVTPVIAIGIH